MSHIEEEARRTNVAGDADVVVCGAGPAGIAAALAAARSGAKTRLIEANGCLGGVWTAGQLAWLFEMAQPGIAREITCELDRRGARQGDSRDLYAYDIEPMKLLLEEMCQAAGIQFHLRMRATAAAKSGRGLRAVITESKSGREAWTARCFVDATGDGDLAALSGCGFSVGRPESGECQPMTFMALASVRDAAALSRFISFWDGKSTFDTHLSATANLLAEIRRAGVEPSYARPTIFQANGNLLALMLNHEYHVSAIDERQVTAATVRGRAEVNRITNALRKLGGPWEGMTLAATCEHIGVREGRRINGLYHVTEQDLKNGARHADAVCRVHFGVDIHSTNPKANKGQEEPNIAMRPYDIPLRALITSDVDNLLTAGRCLSGDFIAHSSYRVTGTAVATGQAAGAAAALSAQGKTLPKDLAWPEVRRALETAVRFEHPA